MQTVTFTRTLARQAVAALALVAIMMSLVPVQALAQEAPVVPQVSDRTLDGNPSCLDLDANFLEIKLETGSGEVANGTSKGITLSNVTVKENDANEPMTFDWSKAAGEKISAVIVKAASGAYVYDYNPVVNSDTNLGTQSNNAISHISFCYEVAEVSTTLTLEKDTAGGGDAVATDWTLKIEGAQGNTGAGTVTRTWSEAEFDALTPEWDLVEVPTDPTNPITDNYVAGNWDCDGGVLVGNKITLEKGDDVTCTITNTYTPPVLGCTDRSALNFKADANTDDGSCTYMCAYSDEGATVDGAAAIATYVHRDWTKEFVATPAKWIWDAAQVTTPSPHTRTFTKTFFSPEATTGELKIAVDNLYTATLNDIPVSCDGASGNNHAAADVCAVSIKEGINTLVIVAENLAGSGGYTGNPAGVIFTITTVGNSCVPVDDLGSITIVKEVVGGAGDWSFDFTSPLLGAFTLTDEANSKTFSNVVAGEYLVNETILDGWTAPVVTCTDGSGAGQGEDQLVVALGAGEDVTCTFTNTAPLPPVCPVGPGLAGVNLLANGSFEEPVINVNWAPSAIADWVITKVVHGTPTLGEIWANGFGGGASEGAQLLELAAGEPVKISQPVVTVPGAEYELRFDYRSRIGTDAAKNGVAAKINGDTVNSVSGIVADWTTYAKTFTAFTSATDVSFEHIGAAGSEGTLLDNAVLCQTTAAPTFTISGFKYNDLNGDGIENDGGAIVEDWEFELLYDGVVIDSTTTDEDGYYEFVIQYEGGKYVWLYEVREVMPNENSGWEMTGLEVFLGESVFDVPLVTCQLPAPQFDGGLVEGNSGDGENSNQQILIAEGEDRVMVIGSPTLTCNFLNHKDTPNIDEDEPNSRTTSTRTNRGRSGQVAGASTSAPETATPTVLGDQISVVPLGAAAAGAGGAAPVELPASNNAAVAFMARRK